jgi:hypothetical protein
VTQLHRFSVQRRLPLLSDILSECADSAAGDYIVFANTDICFVPHFYEAVDHFISKGHDALIINRRRVPQRFMNAPLEVQMAHAGLDHLGFDCFVIKKTLIAQFFPAEVCMGVPPSGNDLFYNIFTFAGSPLLLTRMHLTWHIGVELVKEWGSGEYLSYNRSKWKKMLRALRSRMDISKFPGAGLGFFKRHYKWLMNPTFDYPTMFRLDMSQLGKKRKKYPDPEIHGMREKYHERLLSRVNFPDEAE